MSSAASYQRVVLSGTNDDGSRGEVGIERGGVNVNLQDQITPVFSLYFTQAVGAPTALSVSPSVDDTTITVDDPTGFTIGTYIRILSGASGENRYYFGNVTAVNGSDIDIDTPIDFAFDAGDTVIRLTRDLNVNGATSTQTFAIQVGGPTTQIEVDITRIILVMNMNNPGILPNFGDISGGLTNGIVLRRVDGDTRNIWNCKTNSDLAQVAYDAQFYDAAKQNDINGFTMLQTFAGQSKHGAAIRLVGGDSLEMLIQDDLSSLTRFRIIAQGHHVSGD
jgi:hypothetical protein